MIAAYAALHDGLSSHWFIDMPEKSPTCSVHLSVRRKAMISSPLPRSLKRLQFTPHATSHEIDTRGQLSCIIPVKQKGWELRCMKVM